MTSTATCTACSTPSRATASVRPSCPTCSEDVKRRLLKVPMVKKVDVLGKQAERIYVEFSHERLAALGITPQAIAESLRSQNSVVPAGSIDTRGDRVLVRVSGQFASEDDIRNVPIAADGRVIKLGDFTTITRGFEDPPTYTIRHNGQQVLMLGIVMTGDGNIVDLGEAIEGAVTGIQAELPYGVELERVADQPTTVKEAVWDFEKLPARSTDHRDHRELAQPRLAHRHRRRLVRAARVGRRCGGHARDGLESRAHFARLADHRARPARG